MSVQTDRSIAALVEDIMDAHAAAYDAIVSNSEAEGSDIVAALVVQVLHDLRARGIADQAVDQQVVAYIIPWYFGRITLEVMRELGPALEELARRMRREAAT